DIWRDVDNFLRERTCKFLVVLSRMSNEDDGVLNQLQVASHVSKANNLHDFIIPLRIDDLSPDEYNIQLSRIQPISFDDSWASGLNTLLAKLERDGVRKSDSFTPG